MTTRGLAIIALAGALLGGSALAQQSFPPLQGPLPGAPQQGGQAYPQQQPYPQQQQSPPQQYPQAYPQQGTMSQQGGMPQPSGYGQQGYGQAPAGPANLDAMMQMERQDYGVPAQAQLHNGEMHGPTPSQIPGGQVITTKGLVPLLQNQQVRTAVFDVLGGPETIPGALFAVPAHQGGSYQDQVQQQLAAFLEQVSAGNKQMPLVFYCQGTYCWMSYNAALRAINLGYTNVLWYRGGIEAWKQAGLPTAPAGGPAAAQAPQQPYAPQQGGYPQQGGGYPPQQGGGLGPAGGQPPYGQ